MDEETFFPQWENLKLTEAEEQVVLHMDDDQIAAAEKELQNALVCKILESKLVNVEAFRSLMPKIWNLEGKNVRIENVGFNIYLCLFKTPNDKQRVLEDGPWCFDKRLLVFEQPPRGYCKFTDLEFQYASFWLHFHLLPLACFSRKMAIAFGNLVGSFEAVETDDEGMCWGSSMRVRIRIDVKKPLRRVVKLKVGSMGKETVIPITYEKLPDFCYGCGKLGHVLKDCDPHCETAEEDLQYGKEGWEEDSKGSDNQNSTRSSESAPDGRRESPESISDCEEREVAEEDSAKNGKEKIEEESVGGVISGENKEGDGKMKESMRKAGLNEMTKGENGDVAHLQLQEADQQIKKKDKGKMKWAEQKSWKEGPEMGLDQMEAIGTRRVSMGPLRKVEWRSRGPAKESNP